ncbi:MAG: hypothetical protein AAF417_15865 [Pseudomonadota bacterium]
MDATAVNAFFESYASAWAENDAVAIASHWNPSATDYLYKAEELPEFLVNMEQITGYWKHNERFHERIRLRFGEVTLKPLPGGALAVLPMRWDIRFSEGVPTLEGGDFPHAGKMMGGENHVLTQLVETNNGIKLEAWVEAPDAPITYMRRLYEWAADSNALSRGLDP